MSEELRAILNDDGVFEEYDDTYDLTIHCENEEEQEEVFNRLNWRWIPVSERLPKDRDWYLGIFKEPDTGWINPIPFICDYAGRETKATTKDYWILRGLTDMDEHIDYYFNLECVAWMPLPEPYKADKEEEE